MVLLPVVPLKKVTKMDSVQGRVKRVQRKAYFIFCSVHCFRIGSKNNFYFLNSILKLNSTHYDIRKSGSKQLFINFTHQALVKKDIIPDIAYLISNIRDYILFNKCLVCEICKKCQAHPRALKALQVHSRAL
jgi:hypothetical protein